MKDFEKEFYTLEELRKMNCIDGSKRLIFEKQHKLALKQKSEKNNLKTYVQKSKEDYWKCKCGSYHKGFPYVCPILAEKRRIIQLILGKLKDTDLKKQLIKDIN